MDIRGAGGMRDRSGYDAYNGLIPSSRVAYSLLASGLFCKVWASRYSCYAYYSSYNRCNRYRPVGRRAVAYGFLRMRARRVFRSWVSPTM